MTLNLRRWLHRRTAGVALASLALLALFLYLRFPGEAVTDHLRAVFASRFPQTRLTLATARLSLPPGLATDRATFRFAGQPEGPLSLERLTLRPALWPLLQGRVTWLATAEGYGGTLEGRIAFPRAFSLSGPPTAEGAFRELQAERNAWLRELLFRPVTGRLRGTWRYTGAAGTLWDGTGQLDFTWTNGSFPLREALLGVERLDFNRIEGRIGYRNGALQLTQLTLTGDRLRLSCRGNILLAERWADSRLDLTGTVELAGAGGKRARVAIEGTVANPKTRLQ
jgi:type II secretion system protein N